MDAKLAHTFGTASEIFGHARDDARPLTDAQYKALARFRHALRQFLAFSDTANREHGLTTQQYQALVVIRARAGEEVRIRDLAEEMLLRHNAAVQLVDRLGEAGLVRRIPSRDDARAVALRLTKKGEERIAELASLHYRELLRRQTELNNISALVRLMDAP